MRAFHSTTMFKGDYSIMSNIAEAVARDFENENFKIKTEKKVTGGYVVSVTKGTKSSLIADNSSLRKKPVRIVVVLCSAIGISAGIVENSYIN